MADSLYLSIWFPSFREGEMMTCTLTALRQFPFSAVREGITYLSVHPVGWAEPTVLERRLAPGISPEEAGEVASEFAHDDFAFVFEAFWDLWVPNNGEQGDSWVQRPLRCASSFTAFSSTKASTPKMATSRWTSDWTLYFVYGGTENFIGR